MQKNTGNIIINIGELVQRYKQSRGLPIERAVGEAGLLIPDLQETGRTLGTGSYGEVVEVQVRGQRCAAKKLHGVFTLRDVQPKEKSAMTERFEAECRRVLYLSHPNIIEMIGIHFDQTSRLPTLVMELMDTSLCKYLENNSKSSVLLSTKYTILHDVASGLLYLHSLPPPLGPIVHRDLTANNILLALRRGVVTKIADLGQAKIDSKFATRQQQLSKVPGNEYHMPPEAWLDNPVYDASLDVFSFGVVILHTLTHLWPKPLARFKSSTVVRLEVERRKEYLDKISDSPLKPMVVQCLSQESCDRPGINNIFSVLESIKIGQAAMLPNPPNIHGPMEAHENVHLGPRQPSYPTPALLTNTNPPEKIPAYMIEAMKAHEKFHLNWQQFPMKTGPDYSNLIAGPSGPQVANQQPIPSKQFSQQTQSSSSYQYSPPTTAYHQFHPNHSSQGPHFTNPAIAHAESTAADQSQIYHNLADLHLNQPPGPPQRQHSHLGHQHPVVPPGGGWEGRQASHPTIFQNFPPTISHTAGWDGIQADPNNPTAFVNYPPPGAAASDTNPFSAAQVPGHSAAFSHAPHQFPMFPAVSQATIPSNAAARPVPKPRSNVPSNPTAQGDPKHSIEVHQYPPISHDSLISNLPPPITDFTTPLDDMPYCDPSIRTGLISGFLNPAFGDSHGVFSSPNPSLAMSHETASTSESSSSIDLYGSGPGLPSYRQCVDQAVVSSPNPSVNVSHETASTCESSSSYPQVIHRGKVIHRQTQVIHRGKCECAIGYLQDTQAIPKQYPSNTQAIPKPTLTKAI